MPPNPTPPTLVLGMHRSGTSLVARLINLAGLSLGPEDDLLPATAFNEKGYWEAQRVLDINTSLLHRFGGDWDNPPRLPADWVDTTTELPEWDQAKALVVDHLTHGGPWGWKEPRTTLTLPFWRRILATQRVLHFRALICIRNPLDVAASLEARDQIALPAALALWHYYTEAALRRTHASERLVVFYEDFFQDYRRALEPMLGFLGLPPLLPSDPRSEPMRAFIDSGLQHHARDAEEVQNHPEIPDSVKRLYAVLRSGIPATEEYLATPVPEEIRRALYLQFQAHSLQTEIKQLRAVLNTRPHRMADALRQTLVPLILRARAPRAPHLML